MDTTAQIQQNANNWMNAYNNKDAATIAKMYTEDAVYSNAGWTASGRAAITDGLNKEFGLFKVGAIVVDQGQRLGDMSYSRGTWKGIMTGPDGKDVPVDGHWLSVEKCQGQDCLIMVHNINLTMPPPK
jgi:uncharacterized protein (TIGR02246 family)